jgi:sugar phosphate isomerase/epimerase
MHVEEIMRLALVTEGMINRSIDGMMDWLDANLPDVRDLEIATGGYSPPGHSPFELPRADIPAWKAHIEARGFRICALNVSGNPLHPNAATAARHDRDLRLAIEIAAELGIDRIVAMSGCPGAAPSDRAVPHFAANSWLPDYLGVADWQFENRLRPYWQEINALVEQIHPDLAICLELHPGAHVFNTETFLRLNAAAPRISVNLDPSHLFWQRMDPMAVIARLGKHITYAHGKDVRYNDKELGLNGLLDNRWPGDPNAIPWDFAAVGFGAHDRAWWRAFSAALERDTQAPVVSIEHEDRLHPPEEGIPASAVFLREGA